MKRIGRSTIWRTSGVGPVETILGEKALRGLSDKMFLDPLTNAESL